MWLIDDGSGQRFPLLTVTKVMSSILKPEESGKREEGGKVSWN